MVFLPVLQRLRSSLEVEKGFQRISGYADLPSLTKALERPKRDAPDGLVSNEFAAHKISVGLSEDDQTAPHT
jgi:hypothetical protein